MTNHESFAAFFQDAEPLVRRALAGRFGGDLGREAAAEAFTITWRNWDRVGDMSNRSGYVYRVGERWASRYRGPVAVSVPDAGLHDRYQDVELADALEVLSPKQRQAVVLIEGFGLTHREAAELLGCAKSTIQNHVERGLKKLRSTLEADHATR